MKRTSLLGVVAAVFVVLGLAVIVLQPDGPDPVCTSENGPTSGFYDEDQDCAISIESWNEIAEFESGPRWFNIAGSLLIVIGVGFAVAALVSSIRSRRSSGPRAP